MLRSHSFDSLDDERALLAPGMGDPERQASRFSSVFALASTMVGGGVLSLSYSLSRSGLALGLGYLILSALASALSIGLLVSSSRRSGAQSYEDVVEKTFGRRMKLLTMLMVILLTFLASVAYLLLARDLAVPLFESYVIGEKIGSRLDNSVAVLVIAPILPLCYAYNLHSLRFTSFASLAALLLLSLVMVIRCVDRALHVRAIDPSRIKWASEDVGDSLYAIPFFQLSFLCHFNVLPVHVGLKKPTRKRLNFVIFWTIACATAMYLIISVSGYLYAFDHKCNEKSPSTCTDFVPANILNSFDEDDILIDLGRIGILLCLVLSFPLLVLPCRETLIRMMHLWWRQGFRSRSRSSTSIPGMQHGYVALAEEWEQHQESTQQEEIYISESSPDAGYSSAEEDFITPGGEALAIIHSTESPEFRTPQLRRQRRRIARQLLRSFRLCTKEGLEHAVATTCILMWSLFCMVVVPGVAVVLNLMGSTIGIAVGFILPAGCYVKLRCPEDVGILAAVTKIHDNRFRQAWLLLVFSIFFAIVCTAESIRSII